MKAKYINPFTDFGFKKIFGEEASKNLLIDFLNNLLRLENKIVNLTFKNTEQVGQTSLSRNALFDIYCESDKGEKFIVELQKLKQNRFIDRTIYYATFPIIEQAEKGDWSYEMAPVYCIAILGFAFTNYEGAPEEGEVVHIFNFRKKNGVLLLNNNLTLVYVEMPNFKKEESELKSRLDKWLYFIKNLEDIQVIPTIFKDDIFTQAFEKAELAKLGPEERSGYEAGLKAFRDRKGEVEYGIEQGKIEGKIEGIEQGKIEGKIEGIEQGKIEVAKALKEKNVPLEIISSTTGLSEKEIEQL